MGANADIRKFDAYVPRVLLRRLATAPDEPVLTLEGSVVFVDLSGFTRLSERLARHGREGAEHIVETINSCFSVLLADAYANGGSLLKFGGDALLLWFDGSDHVLRASASAVAMRRTLRRIGRIRTGGAEVVLRMSVGVNTGRYETFLVGESHREFLIAGPAATTVVEMEAAASAGQILVSPATAALLPDRWMGAPCGPGTLLARAPLSPAWSAEPAVALPPNDAVAGCLSTAVHSHLLAAPAAAEHRTATVAFLQFGRFDELIAREGAATAATALDALVRAAQEAADRYEICFLNSDIAADGGKLLFSAGAPRAVGDDEERMLLAMRQIIEAKPRLPIRIGVNRGYTFTGEVGPPYRRTYVVMGDVVNVAARLMAKARWGTIYTVESVLAPSRAHFETTAVPPFQVKGKTKPISALEVGPARRALPAAEAQTAPLAGRDDEVAALRQAIAQARAGGGSLVELIGEIGSGKSRLLTEAQACAESMVLLRATCASFTQAIPYGLWRDLLRQLIGVSWEQPDDVVLERLRAVLATQQPKLLPWLPLLAIAAGVETPSTREVDELSPEFQSAKLHEVVVGFLEPALRTPTLVLIQNTHRMDEASAALLDALAVRLLGSCWAVVAARRPEPGGFVPSAPALRIDLEPLSPEATRALAESLPESHLVPPHVLEQAVERSAGSPGFLRELLAAAAGGSDTLPDTLEAAASARIDALDPGDRGLVRRAAVLGYKVRTSHLDHVLEPGTPPPDEATWQRLGGVLVADGDARYRFRSPILREAAYVGLPFRLRRSLHGAVAAALEADMGRDPDADPAVLSLHFSQAGDSARARTYALVGAERAAAQFAHADAAGLYRRAIEAGRATDAAPEELAAAWEALGQELRLTGEPKAALHALTMARRLSTQDPVAQARLFHRHADIAERHERLTTAVRWLNRGLRVLDGTESRDADVWRSRLIGDLGGVRMRQGRVAEAIRLSEQAIAIAEDIGELRALARACYLLDWALVESGRQDEATHSQRALEIYAQLGDPEREARVVNNLGTFAYGDGRWDEAVALYRRGSELSLRAGNLDVAATGDCNIGEILSDQGRLVQAAAHLERAQRVWRSVGHVQGAAFATLLLGRLAIRDGRWGEGLVLLHAATAELDRMHLHYYVGLARACTAEGEAMGGDPRAAISITDELLAGGDRNVALIRRVRGLALVRIDGVEPAIEQLELSASAAADTGNDYELAAALDALDALGARPGGVADRDRIMARLKIVQLPRPPFLPPGAALPRRPLTAAVG